MIILVFGLPATGKTYFSEALAEAIEARHLNTDMLRHRLGKQGRYDPETKQLVYEKLLEKVKDFLNRDLDVVVDGTFHLRKRRGQLKKIARDSGRDIHYILLRASENTVRKRLQKRREYSEADLKVYKQIAIGFEPVEEDHLELWSDKESLQNMIEKAKAHING